MDQVIVQQDRQADAKRDQGELPQAKGAHRVFIPAGKFPDHPGAVGNDPKDDGQVVKKFGNNMPGLSGNDECYRKGGYNNKQGE